MSNKMRNTFFALLLLYFFTFVPFAIAQTCTQADVNHPLTATATWVDNATNESGFVLERKLNNGAYAVVASGIGANITKYVDSTVVRGSTPNTYTYRIKATAASGGTDSAWSNEACITFAATPPPPVSAPTGLTMASISSSTMRITWEDLPSEIGYEIEGKESRGNDRFVNIASLAAERVTYDWTGRKRYTPYCVRLRGLLPIGGDVTATDYSSTVCATTAK